MKLPENCINCKHYNDPSYERLIQLGLPAKHNGYCMIGYRNPVTEVDKGINQLKHGGEFPCSRNPYRHKINSYFKHHNGVNFTKKIINIKYVLTMHFPKPIIKDEE